MLTIDDIKQRIKETHNSFTTPEKEVIYFNTYKDKQNFILAEFYITVLALLETNMNESYFIKLLDKNDLTVLQKETINFILTKNINVDIILKNFKPTKKYN